MSVDCAAGLQGLITIEQAPRGHKYDADPLYFQICSRSADFVGILASEFCTDAESTSPMAGTGAAIVQASFHTSLAKQKR